MRIDRGQARAAFDRYVEPYTRLNSDKVRLKTEHTLRVADLCDRVARSLHLSEEDIDLAWLLGLLHDIGRFEQIRRYATFSDAHSVSHAKLGVSVLFDEGRIRDYVGPGEEDGLIREAIATHSDYRLPQGQDARTRQFCDILRDCDKIDILRANCDFTPQQIFGATPRQMAESPLSKTVVDAFYGHRTVLREQRRYPADITVSYACFVFELVYPESRVIAREQGCVFEMLDMHFTNQQTAAEVARMRGHLRVWLEKEARS